MGHPPALVFVAWVAMGESQRVCAQASVSPFVQRGLVSVEEDMDRGAQGLVTMRCDCRWPARSTSQRGKYRLLLPAGASMGLSGQGWCGTLTHFRDEE